MMCGLRIALVAAMLTASLCMAQAAATGSRNSLPIQIKANELLTDSAARTATFIGKVSARQGDISIYADKLVIHYSIADKAVEKVEAFGNVRIVQGNRLAEADHAVYDNSAGKIVLDGSPKVVQGQSTITGRLITYYVDRQESDVTSGPGEPVKATINPNDMGKNGDSQQ
jgi:lipopolysaccharide export system protein LptA